ncbi:MAG: cation:dicarboxylate symporter family transporter, partial [Candidatus Rhabdochlamydia sp.]
LIFILVAISQFIYIACIYLVSNRFNFPSFLQALKNMLPAAITGFSSMSSAAAMPLTIIGSEKNTQNPSLTRLATPLTVNTHLIGDCFAIPIFAFAIMKNFGIPEPTFFAYLLFALYFVMAKFSVAAIPGGGIIVMLPILESQLGFTAEMSSLITALYILFDPVITCTNILGNGGFTLTLSKLPVFSKLAKI